MEKKVKNADDKIAQSPYHKYLEEPPVNKGYEGTDKLKGKVALITGGDSGIGRSVAVYFAREGADVAIVFDKSEADAAETIRLVEAEGQKALAIQADLSEEANCRMAIEKTKTELGALNILVNNAGTHTEDNDIRDIDAAQLQKTFAVNIFSFFYCCKAALDLLGEGDCIINTASIVAYRGSDHLLDYASTKGAVVAFTRSLSTNLAEKKIRVNAVAPGPVWTPLVVASFDDDQLEKFGKDTPLGRAGYPRELAPAYVYLASEDSSFVTGQVIHVNGGEVING